MRPLVSLRDRKRWRLSRQTWLLAQGVENSGASPGSVGNRINVDQKFESSASHCNSLSGNMGMFAQQTEVAIMQPRSQIYRVEALWVLIGYGIGPFS